MTKWNKRMLMAFVVCCLLFVLSMIPRNKSDARVVNCLVQYQSNFDGEINVYID